MALLSVFPFLLISLWNQLTGQADDAWYWLAYSVVVGTGLAYTAPRGLKVLEDEFWTGFENGAKEKAQEQSTGEPT